MSNGAAATAAIIEARGLVKKFEKGLIPALNGVDLRVAAGEFISIVGPSGCGKSTLLHLIAALDRPDAGSIVVNGHELAKTRHLDHVRARDVALIFQLHNLLPTLTAIENVQVPMFEVGISAKARRQRAERLLELVGLQGKAKHHPTELSGGERQRVAIARALANEAPILLADEPTGSLDSKAGERVLSLLEELRAQRGLTIVMVTHAPDIAARADRIVRMLDGKVVGEEATQRAAARPEPLVAEKA
jgi:putative ABC transport system ATP-binding protein